MQDQPKPNDGATWAGFLVMAFFVVGLMGGMGIYAAQIPFERFLARDAALNNVLKAASAPDAASRLEALRPSLGDSADAVLTGTTPLPARVAAERTRMQAAFATDSHETGEHLRLVLAAFTIMGAAFGVAVLGLARKSAGGGVGRM